MHYLVSKDSFGSNDFVKDVLAHVRIDSRQRIIQQVYISRPVDGPGEAHPLLLPTREVQSLYEHDHFKLSDITLMIWGKKIYVKGTKNVHTFSPISVASPAGRMSRSGSSAQASSTRWYHVFSFSRPNMTLSWTVAFWIQACWGTYATEPCEDRCPKRDCQYLSNVAHHLRRPCTWNMSSSPWQRLDRFSSLFRRAWRTTKRTFHCPHVPPQQQGNLVAHGCWSCQQWRESSRKYLLIWLMTIYSFHCLFSQLIPFKTRRAVCRPAESAVVYHHVFPIWTWKDRLSEMNKTRNKHERHDVFFSTWATNKLWSHSSECRLGVITSEFAWSYKLQSHCFLSKEVLTDHRHTVGAQYDFF